jgi:hypothetical protein
MRTTTVKRLELLEIIQKNREQHIADYNDACAGYRETALELLSERADKIAVAFNKLGERIKAGETIPLNLGIGTGFDLKVPETHVKDYDQVIRMLELEVDETVKLQTDEFACFVMDDWDWKDSFSATVGAYSKKF